MITAVIRDCPQGGVTLLRYDSKTRHVESESHLSLGRAIDAHAELPWRPAETDSGWGVLAVAETDDALHPHEQGLLGLDAAGQPVPAWYNGNPLLFAPNPPSCPWLGDRDE